MPSKIKVSHILVEKHSEALTLIEKLKKGENFANIAKKHSTCPSSKRGGNLGRINANKVVRPFWIAASKLKIGEITNEPIKTNFGYHIIKRTR
jgi:parvulin-like peptidyl-prolyl isomerase